MEENKKSQYEFLSNEPIGEDLFSNKSQEGIAQIIRKKILSADKFKIIGIDGEWGSGKSNLISIIKNRAEKDYKILIYDVWGHQEDQQRRAILIKLTEFVRKNKLVKNEKYWKTKIDDLLAKRRITESKNSPNVKFGFILFLLLSVMYGPIIISYGSSIKNTFLKYVIYASPLILSFFIFISSLIKNWSSDRKTLENLREGIRQASQVYTDKQEESTKYETISESEPSVREFRKWIGKLDEDLKDKKIILVFDNFDRLPQKHILKIWSFIHVFFAEKKYNNIKVILPFDREHLQNAFNHLNISNKGNGDRDSELKTFADDYINKTFDVVFRISRPLMSDWKRFFRAQWEKAFKGERKEELEPVITAFEFLNRRITPREINSLINEILSLKLIDSNYKERYLAIFCLKRKHILANPLRAITTLDYLNGLEFAYEYDEEFQKQITAIVYQVKPDKAIDLIYTTKLRDALYKNDVSEFNKLCDLKIVNDIFDKALTGINNYKNPIKTLSKIDEDTKLSQSKQRSAWNLFYRKIKKIELKENLNYKLEEWQYIILEQASDSVYLRQILNSFPFEFSTGDVMKYVQVIDKIKKSIGHEETLQYLKKRDAPAEELVAVIERKGVNYKDYRLECQEKDLDKYLTGLSTPQLLELNNTQILIDNYELNGYKESLSEKLNRLNNEVDEALGVIKKQKETGVKLAKLNKSFNDSKISSFYTSNKSDEGLKNEMLAFRIARGAAFSQNYRNNFSKELKSNDKELAERVSNIILNYISFSELLLMSSDFKGQPVFKNIILNLLDGKEKRKENASKVILRYGITKQSLGILDPLILEEINNWDFNFDEIEIEKLDDNFMNDCWTLREIEISKALFKRLNTDFKRRINEVPSGIFDSEEDFFFRHFTKLSDESLTQTVFDILSKKFIEKLKVRNPNNTWWDVQGRFEEIENVSTVDHWKDVRDGIKSNEIEWGEKNMEKVLKTLPFFFKNLSTLESDDDLFRKIFKNEFLSDTDYISLLLKNAKKMKILYKSVPYESKEPFRNNINDMREKNNEIDQLAKELDIRKSKKKE